MENIDNSKEPKISKESSHTADKTSLDSDADKTGTDTSSDKTKTVHSKNAKGESKFDKPKRETDPDRTGIDINSDKTSSENVATQVPTNTNASK